MKSKSLQSNFLFLTVEISLLIPTILYFFYVFQSHHAAVRPAPLPLIWSGVII